MQVSLKWLELQMTPLLSLFNIILIYFKVLNFSVFCTVQRSIFLATCQTGMEYTENYTISDIYIKSDNSVSVCTKKHYIKLNLALH